MAEEKKKSKMTLDKLALMVGGGFNAVDKRFDGLEVKVDDMDERLERVEDKVESMDFKLFELNNKVDNLEISFGKEIKQVKKRIGHLENTTLFKS